MTERTTLDLTRYIPALLTFVSNKMSHGASEKYRRLFGIGISEWRVMSTVAVEPGCTASRLCEVIGFDKALASRTVRKLAEQGLVTVVSDAHNSSRTNIRLSLKGERLHKRVLKVNQARERILLSALTATEIELLIDLLHRLHVQADLVNEFEPDMAQDSDEMVAG
jgi:DNA-binding MarR family transcriptional regulator